MCSPDVQASEPHLRSWPWPYWQDQGSGTRVLSGLKAERPLYVYIWKYSICQLKIELMISLFNTRRQLFGGIIVSLPFKCSAIYGISKRIEFRRMFLRITSLRSQRQVMKCTLLSRRKTVSKPLKEIPYVYSHVKSPEQ